MIEKEILIWDYSSFFLHLANLKLLTPIRFLLFANFIHLSEKILAEAVSTQQQSLPIIESIGRVPIATSFIHLDLSKQNTAEANQSIKQS